MLEGLSTRQRRLLVAGAVALLSVVLYARTLSHPLIWDARSAIFDDPGLTDLHNVPTFFTTPAVPPAALSSDSARSLPYYRPLLRTFQALQLKVFGTWEGGYHLVNVLLGALGAALFFLVLLRLGFDGRIALFAALFWTVSPTRTEAIAWGYGLSNLMVAVFALLALGAWHSRRHLTGVVWLLAALLTREDAVVLPVLALLHELLVRERLDRRFRPLLVWFGLVAAFVVVRSVVVGGAPPLTEAGIGQLALTIPVVVLHAWKLLAAPPGAVSLYPLRLYDTLWWEPLAGLLLIAVGTAAFVLLLRRDRRVAFWLAWSVVWLSLWFNVGRFGDFLFTEKAAYLPAAGLCVVLAWAVAHLRRHATVVIIAVVILHGTLAVYRTTFWRDPRVFFAAAVASAPELPSAHYMRGMSHARAGEPALALPHFEQVVRLVPGHSMAHNNAGNCLFATGREAAAERAWQSALRTDPGNTMAAYNLGMLAERRGDSDAALAYFRRYLEHARSVPPDIAARIRALESRAAP